MPSGLRSLRPSFRVAGQDAPGLASGLQELSVREGRDGMAGAFARFGAWGTEEGRPGLRWMDRALLDFGAELEIRLGDRVAFKGRISALGGSFDAEAPPSLTIHAEDAAQALRMTRRTRVFGAVTDADVVSRVAGEHGLGIRVDAETGPTYAQIAQLNESNLAFLRRRALVAGWDLWIEDGTLCAVARDRQSAPLTLTLGADLRSAEILADLAHQRARLRVGGWSVPDGDGLSAEATSSALGSEASGGDSGPALLSSALGDQVEVVAHTLATTTEEAQAEADALLRTLARRFVVAEGVVDAAPPLRVGRSVDLRGVGPLFEGAYAVVSTDLRFDGRLGLHTLFQAERPWVGRP